MLGKKLQPIFKEIATKCGEELRKLIHTYTGLDTHELSKN